MAIDRERTRQLLKAFEFRKVFIQELGWDNLAKTLIKQIDGHDYRFEAVAEKRGVVLLVSDSIPEYATRVKLDKLIAKGKQKGFLTYDEVNDALPELGRRVLQEAASLETAAENGE